MVGMSEALTVSVNPYELCVSVLRLGGDESVSGRSLTLKLSLKWALLSLVCVSKHATDMS